LEFEGEVDGAGFAGRAQCRLNHCRPGGMRGARAGALAVRPKLNFLL